MKENTGKAAKAKKSPIRPWRRNRVSSRCHLETFCEEVQSWTNREGRLRLVLGRDPLYSGIGVALLELYSLGPERRVGVLKLLDARILERLDIGVRHVASGCERVEACRKSRGESWRSQRCEVALHAQVREQKGLQVLELQLLAGSIHCGGRMLELSHRLVTYRALRRALAFSVAGFGAGQQRSLCSITSRPIPITDAKIYTAIYKILPEPQRRKHAHQELGRGAHPSSPRLRTRTALE